MQYCKNKDEEKGLTVSAQGRHDPNQQKDDQDEADAHDDDAYLVQEILNATDEGRENIQGRAVSNQPSQTIRYTWQVSTQS